MSDQIMPYMKKNIFGGLSFLIVVFVFFSCNSRQPGGEEKTATADTIRKVDKILADLNERIAGDRENDMLYIERADYYLANNKVDSALRDILFAIDINNENPDHYITLSDAYLAMGNPDKCLDALDKTINVDPDNQEAMLKKAQLYLIMQDYDQTYNTIAELIKIDNVNPMAYFVRGYARLEQGDTAKAIRNFQVAVDQKQDYFEAWLQLGMIYSAQNNVLAVEYLKNAIELQPNTIEPYYQMALFFQENGQTEQAITTYNNILDIDPEHKFAVYNLGYINLVYLQNYQAAAEYFTNAIQLDPEYAEAYYNRGYSYELMGKLAFARKDYEKALELERNYPKAIEGLNRLDG